MSEFIKLLIICFVMGLSSYLVGMAPLSFSMSSAKVRSISVLGSGILVGTALVVIVPEGIAMIYSIPASETASSSENQSDHSDHGHLIRRHGGGGSSAHRAQVGLSLLIGFIFMYVVEKAPVLFAAISQSVSSSSNSFTPLSSIDMSSFRNNVFGGLSMSTFSLSRNIPAATSQSSTENPFHNSTPSSNSNTPVSSLADRRPDLVLSPDSPTSLNSPATKPSSTALGLIIHSIADGIALGAGVATGDSSVEAIIFLAIMIHKAPASFGLSAVMLQSEGIHRAKRTLAFFAAAAPIGAILTYFIISFLGENDALLIQWWTGIALLFSGGTFLYVAVHVMQEIDGSGSHGADLNSTYGYSNSAGNKDVVNGAEAFLGIVGMALPLLTLLVPEE